MTMCRRLVDRRGIEINAGDIIECGVPYPEHSERYHVAFKKDQYSEIDVRGLGANNSGRYNAYIHNRNIGHFSRCLKILKDEDLSYYFGLDVKKLKANGVTSLTINDIKVI